MRVRYPLLVRTTLWFLASLLVILAILFFLLRSLAGPESSSPLGMVAGGQMRPVVFALMDELEQRPFSSWNGVLARYNQTYRVTFLVFDIAGTQLAGAPATLPDTVRDHIHQVAKKFPPSSPLENGRSDWGGPPCASLDPAHPHDRFRPPPPDDDPGDRGPHRPPPPHGGPGGHGPRKPPPLLDLFTRAGEPPRYWVGLIQPFICATDQERAIPGILLAVSDNITGHGLFFDPTPWLLALSSIVLFSVIFWLPFVRNITRPLRDMSHAAAQIATGRFDIKLDERRRDEIGTLARAINDMAGHLDHLITGQKRFLGDVAHELATPIAHIQISLGILEHETRLEDMPRLQYLRDEVQQLAELVHELLSFSRAENNRNKISLQSVALIALIRRAVTRENKNGYPVTVNVDPALQVFANPELLTRAFTNILRNAFRYAAQSGPIEVHGRKEEGQIRIEFRDSGPGVPPETLGRLFEPFYRVDPARTRESGGTGLGLAIVKTCIAACNGSVRADNRTPHGLMITITLPAATPVPFSGNGTDPE